MYSIREEIYREDYFAFIVVKENKQFHVYFSVEPNDVFKVHPYPTFPASNRVEITLKEIAGIDEAEYYDIADEILKDYALKLLFEYNAEK